MHIYIYFYIYRNFTQKLQLSTYVKILTRKLLSPFTWR